MQDMQLLELAAKAAGFVRFIYRDEVPYVSLDTNGDDFIAWNPLADDGDAMRLATKLGLTVDTRSLAGADFKQGTGVWLDRALHYAPDFWTVHDDDAGAATRHTIVRAAADIGRRANT